MHPRFANLLPARDKHDQVSSDSTVRVLLRGLDTGEVGDHAQAPSFLEIATTLSVLGYPRTALTYFALGRGKRDEETLLLEDDGFARETASIINATRGRRPWEVGELMVAHNPLTKVSFGVIAGAQNTREVLFSAPGSDACFLYREQNSPTSSGILQVVDLAFGEPCEVLRVRGYNNAAKPLHTPAQPVLGQQELFASLLS